MNVITETDISSAVVEQQCIETGAAGAAGAAPFFSPV
jgi:hypothetical protein